MNKSLNHEVFLSFLLPQNVPVSLNCIGPFTDCNDNFPCPFKDLTPEKKDPFRGEPPRVGPLWGVPTRGRKRRGSLASIQEILGILG